MAELSRTDDSFGDFGASDDELDDMFDHPTGGADNGPSHTTINLADSPVPDGGGGGGGGGGAEPAAGTPGKLDFADAGGAPVQGGLSDKGHSQGELMSLASRQAFRDLVYWKAPAASAAIFAAINVFFFLTYWLQYTIMALTGEGVLLAIAFSILYQSLAWCYARVTERRLVDKLQEYAPLNLADVEKKALHVPVAMQGYAQPLAGAVEGGLTIAISMVREAVLLTSWPRTLQVALAAYALCKLGKGFDAFTLTYLVLVLLFTLPVLWSLLMQQPVFRQHMGTAYAYGEQGWNVVNTHVISRLVSSPSPTAQAQDGFGQSPLRRRAPTVDPAQAQAQGGV